MTMENERYVITIDADHRTVRLQDGETGEYHSFSGARALYDALGVLAEWRDRDLLRDPPRSPDSCAADESCSREKPCSPECHNARPLPTVGEWLTERRLRACVEAWPGANTGGYDPRCCRFPKSCSATVYDEASVTDEDLESRP